MIHLNETQLRQLQMTELELLEEVDRICKKCNIHYNIIAGTLLGAVRHGGFIPWDDDADVALLRPGMRSFARRVRQNLIQAGFIFRITAIHPGIDGVWKASPERHTVFAGTSGTYAI